MHAGALLCIWTNSGNSVWRPLEHPVEDFPLAVCDGSSVSPADLMAVDHVRKHYVGESLYPLYSPGLRWYFLNRQTKDEVLVFKTFDSSPDARAKCKSVLLRLSCKRLELMSHHPTGCPHTSFRQSGSQHGGHPRESIEVRALVFSRED